MVTAQLCTEDDQERTRYKIPLGLFWRIYLSESSSTAPEKVFLPFRIPYLECILPKWRRGQQRTTRIRSSSIEGGRKEGSDTVNRYFSKCVLMHLTSGTRAQITDIR